MIPVIQKRIVLRIIPGPRIAHRVTILAVSVVILLLRKIDLVAILGILLVIHRPRRVLERLHVVVVALIGGTCGVG